MHQQNQGTRFLLSNPNRAAASSASRRPTSLWSSSCPLPRSCKQDGEVQNILALDFSVHLAEHSSILGKGLGLCPRPEGCVHRRYTCGTG